MKTFAFIFARGGSKGLPGKNLLNLDGIPLLAHSIMIAKDIDKISRIFVSTDSPEIAEVSIRYGAEVIDRPIELAQDDSPEWMSWLHAINWVEAREGFFDCFVSLPATAPLRIKSDVTNCMDLLDKQTDIVVTVSESSRSPYFNMVKNDKGYIKLLLDSEGSFSRRQDVPQIYDMTTVAYVTRPNFIKNNNKIFDGRVKASIVPKKRAIDIDDEIDFRMAELMIKVDQENANA